MVGALFFWEQYGTNVMSGTRDNWIFLREIALPFGCDTLVMIDPHDLLPSQQGSHTVHKFHTVDEAIEGLKEKYPGLKTVVVDYPALENSTVLKDFQHPEGDVLYCFGRDSSGFTTEESDALMACDAEAIHIEPVSNAPYTTWSQAVLAVVLYDRLMK